MEVENSNALRNAVSSLCHLSWQDAKQFSLEKAVAKGTDFHHEFFPMMQCLMELK